MRYHEVVSLVSSENVQLTNLFWIPVSCEVSHGPAGDPQSLVCLEFRLLG
jgi:hypothetical protein